MVHETHSCVHHGAVMSSFRAVMSWFDAVMSWFSAVQAKITK